MKPEQAAREDIDRLLEAAGWKVQNLRQINLGGARGVAVREFPLHSGAADYFAVCRSRCGWGHRSRGPRSCGFTIYAPTSISR